VATYWYEVVVERITEVRSATGLYSAHRADLGRFAAWVAGPDDAADVVSEAMLSLLKEGQTNRTLRQFRMTICQRRSMLLAGKCSQRSSDVGFGVLEMRAAGSDGSFFGAGSEAVARLLREMDRRTDLLMSMRCVLLLSAREESRGGQTVFVFESSDVEIVLDAEGRWISVLLID
jgi:hypothetical protein